MAETIKIGDKQYIAGSPEATQAIFQQGSAMGIKTPTPTTPITPTPGSGSYIEDLTKSYEKPAPVATPSSYAVPQGGNLTFAAKAMGITLAQLLDANPQYKSNPNSVQAGAALKYPVAAAPTTTTPTQTQTSTATPTPAYTPPAATSAEARRAAIEKIKAEIDPGTKPTAFNSVAEFDKLRTQQGVVKDEEELQALQQEALLAKQELRQFSATAGEGTSEVGRIGMMSEKERNANFKLEGLAIRENAVINRLNTKNAYINTAVNLGKQDYTTAYTDYTNEYTKNLKAVDLYNTEVETEKRDAMAGFTTITNLLKQNNVDMSTLNPTLKAQVDTLALQAGLPMGILDTFKQEYPDAKILSPIVRKNADGSESIYFFTQDEKTGIPTLVKTVGLGGGSNTNTNNTPNPSNSNSSTATIPFNQFVDEYMTTAKGKALISQIQGDKKQSIAQAELKKLVSASVKGLYDQMVADTKSATTSQNKSEKFTPTENKKLEQAGLLNTDRQTQLNYLYGKKETSGGLSDEEFLKKLGIDNAYDQ
jgi:hypothetical protein